MLHVQNKYEECSRIYQDTLQNLPEPSPNSTDKALSAVCWYVFARAFVCVRFFFQPFFALSVLKMQLEYQFIFCIESTNSLNINPCLVYLKIYFQLVSRIRNMHGAHRLVAKLFSVSSYTYTSLLLIFDVAFCFYLQIQFYDLHIRCSFFSGALNFFLSLLLFHFPVKHTCGEEAAHFTRNILDRMSFSLRRVSKRN